MPIIFDAHVHIYSLYDIGRLLQFAVRNLMNLGFNSSTDLGILLTERQGQNHFESLVSKVPVDGWRSEKRPGALICHTPHCKLFIFPGRQIVTAEKIEVHALLTEYPFQDGEPLTDVVKNIHMSGCVAAVPWAPGKWFGARGRHIADLLNSDSSKQILLNDPIGRPPFWTPSLYSKFKQTVYGTDPLPFKDQESLVGTYATHSDSTLDAEQPSLSMKNILQHEKLARYGSRLGWKRVLTRSLKAKRAPRDVD